MMDAQTHGRLAAMERRLDDGQKTFDTVREDVSSIKVTLAHIEAHLCALVKTQEETKASFTRHDARLIALEADLHIRDGARSVWGAFGTLATKLVLPILTAIGAALATAWAFLAKGAG